MISEIILRRGHDETWYLAMMRLATKNQLEKEVKDHYKRYIAAGDPEEVACFDALNDWDCLENSEQVNGEDEC